MSRKRSRKNKNNRIGMPLPTTECRPYNSSITALPPEPIKLKLWQKILKLWGVEFDV